MPSRDSNGEDVGPQGVESFYRRGKQSLNIVIIGAGIAGLALAGILGHSGHKVTVLEGAPKIAEVGAGIYASPNLTRLLLRWDLDRRLRKDTDPLSRIDLRRWQHGEKLGAAPVMPEVEQRHGAPQYVIHRADLHTAFMDYALEVAEIRTNSIVVDINFEKTTVTLQGGSTISGDIVVGADGMKSICRRLIYQKLNRVDKARPTGDAAYRALIPLDRVTDPDLRKFVTEPIATRWMGPGHHVQGYPIRHGAQYNIVLVHPDTEGSEESWTAGSSKKEMLSHFGDWDSEQLIELIPDENIIKWQLCDHEILPTWVMGKVVLMGDACHPMLPYIGQGAAQAVEDAAVLALALNQLSETDDTSVFLKAYEIARKTRTEKVVSSADVTRTVLHLPDGPAQQERDAKFGAVARGGDNPDLLGDQKFQAFMWAHDPEKDFLEHFGVLEREAREALAVQG